MAESFLINKFNTGETNYIIVRPPAVYGPGMKGNLKLLFDAVEKEFPCHLERLPKIEEAYYRYTTCVTL